MDAGRRDGERARRRPRPRSTPSPRTTWRERRPSTSTTATTASRPRTRRRGRDASASCARTVDWVVVVACAAVRLRQPAPRRDPVERGARRRRHGRPRVGPGLPPRPPAARVAPLGLDARLVRRLPRLPVLHGGPVAPDRRPRRRALRRLDDGHPARRRRRARGARLARRARAGAAGRSVALAAVVVVGRASSCPYGTAFKLVTVLGRAVAARVRLRLRAPGRPALPGAGPAVGGHRCCSCSTATSRSTAATWPPRWRASSPSRSACRWRSSTSASSSAGLRTGRHRALAAVLLALTGLCHLIPAFFALGRHRW